MRVFKLLKQRKDGTLGPLFINRRQRIPVGEWVEAGDFPTKGYAHRPGWHTTVEPRAPHLSQVGRVWFEAEIEDYETHERPEHQGGKWFVSKRMRLIKRHLF